MDVDDYMLTKISIALSGTGDSNTVAASTLEDLTVHLDGPNAMRRAVSLWRQLEVVLFPSLLNKSIVCTLCGDILVRSTTHGAVTADRSMDIPRKSNCQLTALPQDQNPSVLKSIARQLIPFINKALQDTKYLLLEHAAYQIDPRVAEQ